MSYMTARCKVAAAIVIAVTLLIVGTSYSYQAPLPTQQAIAQVMIPQQQEDRLLVQNTSTSTQDLMLGFSGQQLVMVAPPREDGKIWSGVVTFAASKPVNVLVFHPYDSTQSANNQSYGEPLSAPNPFVAGQEIAISRMTQPMDQVHGGFQLSGSLPFTGTALAFHTIGEPFTVSYTVDAEAKLPLGGTNGTTQ
jgi:hypothetical protein